MENKAYLLTAADFDGGITSICIFREKPTFYVMCQKVLGHLGWTHEESIKRVEKSVEEMLSEIDNSQHVGGLLYSTDVIGLEIIEVVG